MHSLSDRLGLRAHRLIQVLDAEAANLRFAKGKQKARIILIGVCAWFGAFALLGMARIMAGSPRPKRSP